MLPTTIFMLMGLLLLTAGAEGLVRGAASLARRFGLSPLVIGLTVVAFGTSTPELVVSLQAALGGNGDIAIGNVVGSNIGNIALILGGAACIAPLGVQAHIIRTHVPIMIGVSLLLSGLLIDERIGRIDGTLLTLGIIVYTVTTVWMARRESAPAVAAEFDAGVPAQRVLWLDLLFTVGGLGLLVGGAQLLVSGAVSVAEHFGMSQTVIGLTIVGIGTSLPELATSVAAAARGEGDIAIGNVVGSNIFNILGILGVTALIQPLSGGGLSLIDLAVMIGLAVIMLPVMRTQYTLSRVEGAVLLTIYGSYLAYLLG